jgi:proline iminopeptidase
LEVTIFLILIEKGEFMRVLYPPIKPFDHSWLSVGNNHKIYLEQCGNPKGIPLLLVHGGPGLGISIDDRRFADPKKFHIILFDQRGCGKSTPHSEIKNNSIKNTAEDIETIRKHLNIDKLTIFCQHSGIVATISYAVKFQSKVEKIIACNPFLLRNKDIDWLFNSGTNLFFPDYFTELAELVNGSNISLLEDYNKKLFGDNEIVRMNVAKHWLKWWMSISRINIDHKDKNIFNDTHLALSLACIQHYYFTQQKLENIEQLLNSTKMKTPIHIIHGRYNLISPLQNSFELLNHCVSSKINIIANGGYCIHEPHVTDAVIRTINL